MYRKIEIEEDILALKKKDKRVARLIDEVGELEYYIETNVFKFLCESIIGQQISNYAQERISERFSNLVGKITPENVLKFDVNEIRSCGVSFKKAEWILSAAKKFLSSDFTRQKLLKMSDEDFIAQMTKLDGVGCWTAQMLLISSLGRRDVLSFGDLGIRRGVAKILGVESVSKGEFEKFKKKFSPHNTVLSLYLWQS